MAGKKYAGQRLYKSATAGFPRSTIAPGSVPAPTMDEVCRIERKYKTRLHVKRGLMFFKEDGVMYDKTLAGERMRACQT
jgi:hypothetical protein